MEQEKGVFSILNFYASVLSMPENDPSKRKGVLAPTRSIEIGKMKLPGWLEDPRIYALITELLVRNVSYKDAAAALNKFADDANIPLIRPITHGAISGLVGSKFEYGKKRDKNDLVQFFRSLANEKITPDILEDAKKLSDSIAARLEEERNQEKNRKKTEIKKPESRLSLRQKAQEAVHEALLEFVSDKKKFSFPNFYIDFSVVINDVPTALITVDMFAPERKKFDKEIIAVLKKQMENSESELWAKLREQYPNIKKVQLSSREVKLMGVGGGMSPFVRSIKAERTIE